MNTQRQKDIDRVNADIVTRNVKAGQPLTANGGRRVISEQEFYRRLNDKLRREERPNLSALINRGGRRVEQRG